MTTEVKEWIKTDDTQYMRKDTYGDFEFLEYQEHFDSNTHIVMHGYVNLSDFEESEILSYIRAYGYNSIEFVKETYQDEWEQVVAECIFESLTDTETFVTLDLENCITYIRDHHGIDISKDL